MTQYSEPKKIILADFSEEVRKHLAWALGIAEEMQIIAHCTQLRQLYQTILRSPGSIALFGASLYPDLPKLRILLESTGSRALVIAYTGDRLREYLQSGFQVMIFRDLTREDVIAGVRRVAAREFWLQPEHDFPRVMWKSQLGARPYPRASPAKLRSLSRLTIRKQPGVERFVCNGQPTRLEA